MFSPGTVPLRNTMPQIQISFFSDTRSTIAILLILALQITSIIVFYHNQTIMRNEFKDLLTKIYENQCEKHSGLSTERSETDNPARSPGSKDATLNAATTAATISTPTTTATFSTATTPATLSTPTTTATLSTTSAAATLSRPTPTTAATLSTPTTAATLSTTTTAATLSRPTPTTAATLSTPTTTATLSTTTTAATLSRPTPTTAATLSTATTVGVSTTNTNSPVENETIRRYSDLVISYRNWSSEVMYNCENRLERLKRPVTKLYVLETETYICFDYESCKIRMNRECGYFKSIGYPDIQYHFLIGGDGSIFEGLSWNCTQYHYSVPPDRNSIVVALTGYTYKSIKYSEEYWEVTKEQYAALKLFIMANVFNGNLSPSYQLIPHCCEKNSGNPGVWVYTNLSLFEHFYDCNCSY